jgi:hypothetical protein
MRKWALRIFYILLAALGLALLVGFTFEQVGRARDARQLPPRVGQAIDIGGRTLNLDCSGQGSPTVILEPGATRPVMRSCGCSQKWQRLLAPAGTTARV